MILKKLSILLLPTFSNLAALELGPPFRDHAILQREMEVPVWGWSKPGTEISVQFAGQEKSATTGADGKWRLELAPLKASATPAQLVVTERFDDGLGEEITLKDILVGEVWLASGQSNMQWIASKCDVGRTLQKQIAARVESGEEKPPIIRESKITNYFATLHPIEHAEAEWSSESGNFSAIAYAFAYELHRTLKVPIGILNCSFSQTSIQAWTPRVGFAGGKSDYTKALYRQIRETDPSTPEHKQAWTKFYQDIEDTLKANQVRVEDGQEALPIPTKTPGNMSGNRDASWLFNARLHPMIPYAIRGGIWNQGYANMGEGLTYYENLHSLIGGWRDHWNRPNLPVYFHQFYCPGQKGGWDNSPSIGSTAEMRLGTAMARDIPHTGMASQIDITGAIHYTNKALPGQRLALHALKNQYGKQVVADGPIYKSYSVDGDKVTIEFENAEGLVVAETGTNSKSGLAKPTVIPNGDNQVKLFYLADKNRVWHPGQMKIDGNRVIVSSPAVQAPRGISYGTGGIGFQANLYNAALLPTTPFIVFDHKVVTSKTWPDEALKVPGKEIDPGTVGLIYEYRRMPILSTQFRDNAVLQAGKPLKIWGSAVHDWGYEAQGKAVIKFSFDGIQKTIPVTPGMKEWQITLPAMKASAEPKTLKVRLEIDGELAHERIAEGIVLGEVFYIAAPPLQGKFPVAEKSTNLVRMITRKAKRFSHNRPSRFSVCVSTTPKNRFASEWTDASGFAAALGHRIGKKTGHPVGIIFMQTATTEGVSIASWLHPDDLKLAPSLMDDYKDLAAVRPGNSYYAANARRYIKSWQSYWSEYVPKLIETKAVPDEAAWGSYPSLAANVTSKASEVYNVMTHSFAPTTMKGAVFITTETMEKEAGDKFGEQMVALYQSWQKPFGLNANVLAIPKTKATENTTLDKLATTLTE